MGGTGVAVGGTGLVLGGTGVVVGGTAIKGMVDSEDQKINFKEAGVDLTYGNRRSLERKKFLPHPEKVVIRLEERIWMLGVRAALRL